MGFGRDTGQIASMAAVACATALSMVTRFVEEVQLTKAASPSIGLNVTLPLHPTPQCPIELRSSTRSLDLGSLAMADRHATQGFDLSSYELIVGYI